METNDELRKQLSGASSEFCGLIARIANKMRIVNMVATPQDYNCEAIEDITARCGTTHKALNMAMELGLVIAVAETCTGGNGAQYKRGKLVWAHEKPFYDRMLAIEQQESYLTPEVAQPLPTSQSSELNKYAELLGKCLTGHTPADAPLTDEAAVMKNSLQETFYKAVKQYVAEHQKTAIPPLPTCPPDYTPATLSGTCTTGAGYAGIASLSCDFTHDVDKVSPELFKCPIH